MTLNEAILVIENDEAPMFLLRGHEAWQTLKAAVLAAQTNNSQSTPYCLNCHIAMRKCFHCSKCGATQ